MGGRNPGGGVALLPTPTGDDANNVTRASGAYGSLVRAVRESDLPLLPTPAVNDIGSNKTVDWWDDWTAGLEARLHNQNGHGKSLGIEARRAEGWHQYQPALDRWAAVLGRPAPERSEPDPRVGSRLSPRFGEWLMGLPDGHISAVPGISTGAALAMLGNGVVPQQVAAAATLWLSEAA